MTPVRCHQLIDTLLQAETVEEIHTVCSILCEQTGFDFFLYGARIPTSLVNPYFIVIHSYPIEWRTLYIERSYLCLDPSIAHCEKHITPISWDHIEAKEKESPGIKQFMGEAGDFGLKSGISFPVHTVQGDSAMFSVASSDNHRVAKPRILEAIPSAQLFLTYLHETVRKIFEKEVLPMAKVHLTKREKECLLWSAEGKTSWETSQILNVSERTVIFHLQNATQRLNVTNRSQAVARAVTLGLVSPQLG